MNKLKIIGITVLITAGIIFIGYSVKTSNMGGVVQNAPTYATATSTHYAIGDDISSFVLGAKSRRAYVSICNDTGSTGTGEETVYVNLSSTAITATTSAYVSIADNECWEMNRDNLYTGEIQLLTETSTSTNAVKVMQLSD